MKLILIIQGHPRPQPRPRFVNGRVISTADPLAQIWKAKVKAAAQGRKLSPDHEKQPLAVTMSFQLPTPILARHGKAHTQVPDLDNLAKLILDALQDTGTIANDSQVSTLVLSKGWTDPGQAGVVVELEPDLDAPGNPSGLDKPGWIE
jgi:Holliday junction resolvase RusA-like endonuclease